MVHGYLRLDNFFVQLEKTLKLKRGEFIENGKSVLFLGDYITKFKDKITLKSKDAYVDNMLAMLGMESSKPTSTPMVRKESAANDDQEVLEGSEAETYRSVVGILMHFKRHRFDLYYAAKSLAMTGSSPTKSHMRRLKRVLRYIQGTRDMHLKLIRPPRTVDGNGRLVRWIVGRPRRKTEVDCWWFVDAWRSVRGWLVSNAETNSVEQ